MDLDELYYQYDYPGQTTKRVRAQRKTPKPHQKFWCEKCDAQKVHANEKCPNCGFQQNTDSYKKRELYVNNEVK